MPWLRSSISSTCSLLRGSEKLGQPQPALNLVSEEKTQTAGGAEIFAGDGGFRVLPGEGPLGALLAQDAVLLGSERTAPFLIRLANLVHGSGLPQVSNARRIDCSFNL